MSDVAKTPLKTASQVPAELNAAEGMHVFVSREKEVTFFEFADARPNLLADGRLAWVFPEEDAEHLMNHHFLATQRIIYAGVA